MKTYLSIILIVVVLIFGGWAVHSEPQQTVTWEYKFAENVSEKKANELGAEGWELVTSEQTSNFHPKIYIFKRQRK